MSSHDRALGRAPAQELRLVWHLPATIAMWGGRTLELPAILATCSNCGREDWPAAEPHDPDEFRLRTPIGDLQIVPGLSGVPRNTLGSSSLNLPRWQDISPTAAMRGERPRPEPAPAMVNIRPCVLCVNWTRFIPLPSHSSHTRGALHHVAGVLRHHWSRITLRRRDPLRWRRLLL